MRSKPLTRATTIYWMQVLPSDRTCQMSCTWCSSSPSWTRFGATDIGIGAPSADTQAMKKRAVAVRSMAWSDAARPAAASPAAATRTKRAVAVRSTAWNASTKLRAVKTRRKRKRRLGTRAPTRTTTILKNRTIDAPHPSASIEQAAVLEASGAAAHFHHTNSLRLFSHPTMATPRALWIQSKSAIKGQRTDSSCAHGSRRLCAQGGCSRSDSPAGLANE